MYVLAAQSFGDLIDQVQFLQRTNANNRSLVQQVAQYRSQVNHQAGVLTTETNRLRAQDSQARAARDAVLRSLADARAYQAHLSARVRSAIAAQAAAQEAAAARAAAQAAGTTGGTGASGGGGNVPPPPSSTLGGQAVAIAERYLGVPYVWGGASPSGFDCSGLVMYVYAQLGVSLPHNAAAQYSMLPHVPVNDLEPGDLVFFNGFGHVGIYVGGGTMIHAPHTGTVVQFASISSDGPIDGAARVPG